MFEFLYHALVVFGAIVLVVIALVIVTILERRREEFHDDDDRAVQRRPRAKTMDLHSGGALSKQNVTREDVEAAFADDEARGDRIVLQTGVGDSRRFVRATGEDDGPYLLEFRDEISGAHRRVDGQLSKEQVKTAFLDYLDGSPTWPDAFRWRDLQRAGCLGVLLLAAALPAAIIGMLVCRG